MAKILLITDSNFLNNIGAFGGRRIKDVEVKACKSRKAVMQELSAVGEGVVVISCLDMVASDIARSNEGGSGADNAIEFYFNQILYKMAEKIDELDGKVAFGVVAPLFWTSHSEAVRRAINHSYKVMRVTPMNNIWCSELLKDVKAGSDGTHLTRLSANRYIEHVYNFILAVSQASGLVQPEILEAEPQVQAGREDWSEEMAMVTDDEAVNSLGPPDDDELPPARVQTMLRPSISTQFRTPTTLNRSLEEQAPTRAPTMSSPSILTQFRTPQGSNRSPDEMQSRLMRLAATSLDTSRPPPTSQALPNPGSSTTQGDSRSGQSTLERRVSRLESNSFFTNLMTAALKEEQDSEANKAMLNRVTISGVVIDNLTRMNETDKVRAMRAKIEEIITSIKEPEQTMEVQFVRHLNNQVRGQKSAVIEVKLADAQQAKLLRAAFVKKFSIFGKKINITPVVRLATRVRIEILHSVCFYLKRQDPTVVWATCLQFVPKPVIKVIRKSAGGAEVSRTMSFIDAINWVKENGLMGSMDLSKARDRAGASFRGTLAQHFVLLD